MKIEPKTGKYYVIGLSSFGIGCEKVDSYGIYTKVDYFTDWIIITIGISNLTCQPIITT
jgi:secreted trypsin-like serine protease